MCGPLSRGSLPLNLELMTNQIRLEILEFKNSSLLLPHLYCISEEFEIKQKNKNKPALVAVFSTASPLNHAE